MLSSPKIGFQSSWRSAVLGYFHSGSADISQLSPALSLLLGLLKVTEHQGGGGRPPRGWPQEMFSGLIWRRKKWSVCLCSSLLVLTTPRTAVPSALQHCLKSTKDQRLLPKKGAAAWTSSLVFLYFRANTENKGSQHARAGQTSGKQSKNKKKTTSKSQTLPLRMKRSLRMPLSILLGKTGFNWAHWKKILCSESKVRD